MYGEAVNRGQKYCRQAGEPRWCAVGPPAALCAALRAGGAHPGEVPRPSVAR